MVDSGDESMCIDRERESVCYEWGMMSKLLN